MRKLRAFLLATAFAVGLPGHATASIVTLDGGSLSLSPFFGFAIPQLPVTFPLNSTGIPIGVSSGVGGFTEPGGLFTGSVGLPSGLFTGVPLVNGINVANFANGTKVIGVPGASGPRATGILRAGGGLGGPGPLAGTAFVNILGLFNLSIPLGAVGNTGATQTNGATNPDGMVTVQGTGWTTGVVTLSEDLGTTISTATVAGYDNRTPGHGGVLQLVSPFRVIVNIGDETRLVGLAVQTLSFSVPEPATLLLLCSGVATLGISGWLRARRK